MKQFFFLTLLIVGFLALKTSAQQPFYPRQQGLVLSYEESNGKGKIKTYTKTTVCEVAVTDERNFSVTTSSEILDAKKKPMTEKPMTISVTVADGIVRFDPQSFAGVLTEGMQVSGEDFLLPDNIQVGDVIKDYTISVTIGPMKTITTRTGNKVIGKETLDIGGHSLECYIIESTIHSKVLGMKQESRDKTWYARGIGQVKMEIYDKNGKLQMQQRLVAIEGL